MKTPLTLSVEVVDKDTVDWAKFRSGQEVLLYFDHTTNQFTFNGNIYEEDDGSAYFVMEGESESFDKKAKGFRGYSKRPYIPKGW